MLFILMTDPFCEHIPAEPQFKFEADNQNDANHKATEWAKYHSYNSKDVEAIPATKGYNWVSLHNEYVERW